MKNGHFNVSQRIELAAHLLRVYWEGVKKQRDNVLLWLELYRDGRLSERENVNLAIAEVAKGWDYHHTTSVSKENSNEENITMAPGAAVVFINHDLAPINGLVSVVNEGSVDIISISPDPKKQRSLGSGDFSLGIDRRHSVEHYVDRLRNHLLAENAAAEKEGRDASFDVRFESLAQNTYVEPWRVSSSEKGGVISVSNVTLTSSDGLPKAYTVPAQAPDETIAGPEEVLPSAPTPISGGAKAPAPSGGSSTPPVQQNAGAQQGKASAPDETPVSAQAAAASGSGSAESNAGTSTEGGDPSSTLPTV